MAGRGTIETVEIESAVLRGNPLGDPHVRRVPVWLPPSYASAPGRRYPVIYWLAGFTGDGRMLFNWNPWQEGLGERLDRLVGSGAMGECIVVGPDCFTALGGSQYMDSPATGLYETHVCRELLPEIDRRYRTVAARDGRGIGGKSSGGFGALWLGMRHPDLFAAIASHSGDCHFDLLIRLEIPKVVRTLRRHGGIEGFLRHFRATPKKTGDDVSTIMMLADGACYSPDPARPGAFEMAFDLDTGEMIEPVWKRWLDCDPCEMVARHAEALRAMKLVFVDCGTRDEWALDLGARLLATRMRQAGVDVVHEEFDDGHMNIPYRYDVSLPRMAAALGACPLP